MKKLLLAIIAIIACLAIVGCSKAWTSTVTDYAGEVKSNGGFMVEKGDYVYYINGSESNAADNTYGEVIKGAVLRTKKADIGKANATSEVVIPEICYSTQVGSENGLFIFGDYIYYATPCSEKDKTGAVKNTELEYMKTKLDGTDSKVICKLNSVGDNYRYVEIGDEVFLAVKTTNDDAESVIRIYSADKQELVLESKPVNSFVFSQDLEGEYAYYTTTVHNEELDEDESFNAVYRIALDGTSDVEILNGAGTYSDATNGIGIAGVSFNVIKCNKDYLYLSETSVETSTVCVYKGVKTSDIVTEKSGETPATKLNYDKLTTLDNGSSFAPAIFSANSIYIDLDTIIYFDSFYGIMVYDYTKADQATFGRDILYYDEDIIGYTYQFTSGNNCYFYDASGYYYSLNLGDKIDFETGAIKEAELSVKKLNYFGVATNWHFPEFVGDYMLAICTAEPFYSYVYAIDTTVMDGKTDKEIEEYETSISKESRESIEERYESLIGKVSQADSDALKAYLDEKYPQKEESSQSTE